MTQAAILSQLGSQGTTQGFKNRIINGAMVIDQRNAGASVSAPNNLYITDRWQIQTYINSGASGQQVSDAPTGQGFTYSLKFTNGTGSSPSAGNTLNIGQSIEGYNVLDLQIGTAYAKTVTLSFWVKSSVTGTFGIGFCNNSISTWTSSTRSYVATYTISSANTWEQKTVTVALDQTGTWGTTNGSGLTVNFDLGSGSNYETTAGSWAAGAYSRTSACAKLGTTTNSTFQLTGVQLEVGSSATGYEYRNYQQELAMCQRYYEVVISLNQIYSPIANAYYVGSADMRGIIAFKQTKRTTPSLSATSGTDYYTFYRNGSSDNMNNLYINDASPYGTQIYNNSEVSGTAGQAGFLYANSNSAFIAFSAEL